MLTSKPLLTRLDLTVTMSEGDIAALASPAPVSTVVPTSPSNVKTSIPTVAVDAALPKISSSTAGSTPQGLEGTTMGALANPARTPDVNASGVANASVQVVPTQAPAKKNSKPIIGQGSKWTKPSDHLGFRPYTHTNRDDQWAVSDEGKVWISQRIPSFRQMQPPGGLPKDSTTERTMTHRQWWTRELDKSYKDNWPDFDLTEVLGENYHADQVKKHAERVQKFIDNALRRQYAANAQPATDILSILIQRSRKPVAYNVWAKENPEEDTKAANMAKEEADWENPDEHLRLLMEMRKRLFDTLDPLEQEVWQKKAEAAETVALTQEDVILAIPKLFGMVCDSIRKYTQFNCLVLCGGKEDDGKAWYYSEEWRRPSVEDPLGFTSTANWQTIRGAFLHALSKETSVPAADIVQLPTRQRPNEYIPKAVEQLSGVLEFDETGLLLTSEAAAREATEKYLDSLWVKGERGELPSEKVFRWTNQTDGEFQLAPRPRKQHRMSAPKKSKGGTKEKTKATDVSEGENFDLDDVPVDSDDECPGLQKSVPSRDRTVPRGRKAKPNADKKQPKSKSKPKSEPKPKPKAARKSKSQLKGISGYGCYLLQGIHVIKLGF
ncbi:hypothetical protein M422DRAFT_68176 [Sphaerobolus stellatus SS14]|uniref:Unplaced genomic scaffold SPHSTscaffold_60, whole genome shotgun sequence n=1 Tax=Sphaerobolus stellatus (strain SS14) TaxID=990650 RepID=A0A0C9UF31_SPHS4|nr:hypothetical protein M422DRAFT_68176 [Sphaerobolus stellatus SS14]